jgi:GNAT superfamily N-acetyltransferase
MVSDAGERLSIRVGGPADLPVLTMLFDEAIDWLRERGQSGQWGTQHAAERPDTVRQFSTFAAGGGLRVAEGDGRAEGALVLGSAPVYVPAACEPELYVLLLLSSRHRAGRGIGARLLHRAIEEASQAGCRQLRVDCWAEAPSLVAFYEKNGFERDGTFERSGWHGQIFNRRLP